MKKVFLVSLWLLIACGAAFARDVQIKVIDTDLDLPLEGATLQTADGRSFKADGDGIVHLDLPDGAAVSAQVSYPGYQLLKLAITAGLKNLVAKMTLQGVMGSTELVIEARKPGQSDQKIGVSTTVDRQEMKSTANISIIEDVMSTIKTLPGVGYSGQWDAQPSIRGGEPQEMTAVLDGFIIENPYHWGGAFSIFNPNMVQSAKLSNGVFSAAYGYATSGLLEVTSREPDPDNIMEELGITTSSAEVLTAIPYAGKGGLLVGGKVTYYDPLVALFGLFSPKVSQTISQAPFVRDAYLKSTYHISPELLFYVNGFFGSDGIGLKVDSTNDMNAIQTNINFNWTNYLAFGTLGLKWNPSEQVFLHFMAGFGWASSVSKFTDNEIGIQTYSLPFILYYNSLPVRPIQHSAPILAGEAFLANKMTDSTSTNNTYNLQSRLDLDLHPASGVVWSWGATEMIQFWQATNYGSTTLPDTQHPNGDGSVNLVTTPFSLINDQNRAFNSGVYTTLNLKTADELFNLDLGLRLDHTYIMGKDSFALQTYPVLNPRANLSVMPVRNRDGIDSLTFSIGTGLFSRPPAEMSLFDTSYGLQSYEVKPNQVWTSVIGGELILSGGYKILLEGYFKNVSNRFYFNRVNTGTDLIIKPHFDGEAIIWGIDLMLQKYQSRYFDGWLTASYSYARYRNPILETGAIDQGGNPSTATTDWYWPSFHRFFNANLILNFKPNTEFSITTKLTFATGKPQSSVGPATPYAQIQGNTVLEQWHRSAVYSDTDRTEFSIPLDIRISWNWYEPRSKVSSELYLAVENALTNIYAPKGQKAIDPYTGGELTGSGNADFNIGFPLISFGFKWSY